MTKVVFSFDDKSAKKLKNKKYILGGKVRILVKWGDWVYLCHRDLHTTCVDIFYKNKKIAKQLLKILMLS